MSMRQYERGWKVKKVIASNGNIGGVSVADNSKYYL